MYIKKVTGYIETYNCSNPNTEKGLLDTYEPTTTQSTRWKRWVTDINQNTCQYCYNQKGKIFPIGEDVNISEHPNCRCKTVTDIAIVAGTATKDGENGADYWLKNYGMLPLRGIINLTFIHFAREAKFFRIYNTTRSRSRYFAKGELRRNQELF